MTVATRGAKHRRARLLTHSRRRVSKGVTGPIGTPPSAPTLVSVTAGNAQATIAWTDNAAGTFPITAHNLYRGTTAGGEVYVGQIATASPYVDTGLTNGTTYYYKLTAVSAAGESGLSGELSGTPTATVNFWTLVVAGGGGGGGYGGGGGGAGGLLESTTTALSVGSYAITVGTGGAGGVSYPDPGVNGGNSSIAAVVVATGGGGGGAYNDPASGGQGKGKNGGSGGGGGGIATAANQGGGTGTSLQGNAGGAARPVVNGGCGGGGGAGGPAADATGGAGTDGGVGLQSSISGTSTYYAGGGGGGNGGNGGNGADGLGHGANKGGGGTGATFTGSGNAGDAGVVIIRYPTASATCTGGTITTSGADTIHTFTSSGTFQRTA